MSQGPLIPKIMFPSQKLWPVACAQSDGRESENRGPLFQASGVSLQPMIERSNYYQMDFSVPLGKVFIQTIKKYHLKYLILQS